MNIPNTGLLGSEEALRNALMGSLGRLDSSQAAAGSLLQGGFDQALGQINTPLNQAKSNLQPFINAGQGSMNLQAALSGAMGNDAQSDAFSNYMASPGQEFLRDRGEQALLRNQAAIGGLGGGNVRKRLVDHGIGVAAQNYGDDFDRLSTVSNFGLGATGQFNNLAGTQAQLGSALTGDMTKFGAGSLLNRGSEAANYIYNTGNNQAAGRTRVGEQVAGAIGDTSSALSRLQESQGSGIASMIQNGGSNLASLLSGAGAQQGQSLQQLANLLSNISAGQGAVNLSGIPGVQQTGGILGQLGQLASGLGTGYAGFQGAG